MRRWEGILGKIQLTLALGGAAVSVFLVHSEIRHPGHCPRFAGIPACFMILAAFLAILLSHRFAAIVTRQILFAGGSGVGIVLAVWFTAYELLGSQEICPRMWGIPSALSPLQCLQSLWFSR